MLVRHFNKPRTVPYLRITVGTEDDVRRLIAAAELILRHEYRLARVSGSVGTLTDQFEAKRAEMKLLRARRSRLPHSITPPSDVIRPPSKAALSFFRATAGAEGARKTGPSG